MKSDTQGLFGTGRNGHIETMAENAWYEGLDSDANPFNKKHQWVNFWCWDTRWKLCNKWC